MAVWLLRRRGICSTSYREARCHLGRGPHHFVGEAPPAPFVLRRPERFSHHRSLLTTLFSSGRQQISYWPRGRSAAAPVVTASNGQDDGLLAQWPARKQVSLFSHIAQSFECAWYEGHAIFMLLSIRRSWEKLQQALPSCLCRCGPWLSR
jgi:hypothetical protein